MAKKQNNGFNFQAKHLVYILLIAVLTGMGIFFGEKIARNMAEFIKRPSLNEIRLTETGEKMELIEKKLNATTARTNALYEGMDSLVTTNDLKIFKIDLIQTIKTEIRNNLTVN